MRKGHDSFEIKLEDDMPPIHRPLYKMSPRELQEAKGSNPTRCSSMVSSDRQTLPMASHIDYSSLKRTSAFGCALITVG